MGLVYLIDEYRTVSQTFVVNEVCELRRQGVDVRFYALRPGNGLTENPEFEVAALAQPVGRRQLIASLGSAIIRNPRRAVLLAQQLVHGAPNRTARELFALVWVFGHAVRLATLLRSCQNPTHLHAHFAGRTSEVCHVLHRLFHYPFSITIHAADIYACQDQKALRNRLRDASVVVCISRYIFDYVLHHSYLEDASRMRVVRCGIDLDQFSIAVDPTYPKGPTVLTVARLVEKKGIHDLIRAVAQLNASGTRLECKIVGSGPLLDELVELTQSLDCESVVHFLGQQPHATTVRLFHEATIFALPCRVAANGDMDGIPTVLFEAMASGLPVVSTTISGIPEVIHDGVNGLLVPPDSPDALAKALAQLLHDRDKAKRMALAAIATVRQEHDLQRQVGLVRDILLEQLSYSPVPDGEIDDIE